MSISLIFTIISLVITAIFALVVTLKTLKGIKKGAYLQPCSLASLLISVIVAFFATSLTCNIIFSVVEGQDMQGVLSFAESTLGISFDDQMREIFLSFDIRAVSYLLAIPVVIISPIIFVIFYAIFRPIFNLIVKLIIAKVKFPEIKENVSKIIGGVVGGLEGILVMVVFLVPLISILNIGITVMSKTDMENSTMSEIAEATEDFSKTPVLQVANFAGGGLLSRELSTVTLEKSRINIPNEISYAIDLFNDLSSFMSGSQLSLDEMLTPEKEAILNSILNTLEKSEYMPILLSGAMQAVSNVFFADLPETPTDPQDKLLISLSDLLESSEEETVVSDLRTMKELIFFLKKEGVIDILTSDDKDTVASVLSAKDENGNTIIKSAINILKANSRSTGIIAVLNELSISIMCQNMGVGGDTAEVYESLKTGLTDLIAITPDSYATEEEYKQSVKSTLNTTLVENDIVLEEEIVDTMTDYVSDYLEESRVNGTLAEEIRDEDVTEIILTYYDAYLQYQESGELPEGLPIPGEGGSSDSLVPEN